MVEKEARNLIQVLDTDCGDEYNSHEFDEFYENHGMR